MQGACVLRGALVRELRGLHGARRPGGCGRFDNVISRVIGLVLNSNRRACVLKIRELGPQGYATLMAGERRHSLPRRVRA